MTSEPMEYIGLVKCSYDEEVRDDCDMINEG